MISQSVGPDAGARAARGSSTREKLLRAANEIVARDGVSRLTLARVAAEADVSKGGLLYHFENKQALLEALLAEYFDAISTAGGVACEANGHDRLSLAEHVRAVLQMQSEHHTLGSALIAAAATDPQMLLRTWTRPVTRRLLEQPWADPGKAALALAALDGIVLGELLRLPLSTAAQRNLSISSLLALASECDSAAA